MRVFNEVSFLGRGLAAPEVGDKSVTMGSQLSKYSMYSVKLTASGLASYFKITCTSVKLKQETAVILYCSGIEKMPKKSICGLNWGLNPGPHTIRNQPKASVKIS